MRPLNEPEIASLEASLKKTKDLTEWKRIFAILEYDNGQSIEELAHTLRISPFTIEKYLKEYSSHDKTKNDPRGGGHSKLTEEESSKLERHLEQITYLKVGPIIAYVWKQFEKKYSRSGMTHWLLAHGFTYKRPEKIPGKIDPDKQAQFIEEYKRLKSSLGPCDEIYFLDAIHPEYQSQAVFGWIKKGECKTLQTTGKQKRLHFIGALALDGMKIFMREYKAIDAESTVCFLNYLEQEARGKRIHVVLDNAGANKNQKIEGFLKKSQVQLHYLPPYSPNLNPIERLWKVFREITLYNRFFPTYSEFVASVRVFFGCRVHRLRRLLYKRINDNFQIIKQNPIKLS